MSKIFYPARSIDVEASDPHPKGTSYRVSIGPENWGASIGIVLKVQMAYDGKVSGRKSPSYPVDSDDWNRVCRAAEELRREYESNMKRVTVIPAKQPLVLPVSKYVALVRLIPQGKLLREKDIDGFFKRLYGAEHIAFPEHMHWPEAEENGVITPYWRVVSNNGYVSMQDAYGLSQETRIRRLEEDGFVVVPCGVKKKSRSVRDYKEHIFDLSHLDKAWADSIPDTDETRMEWLQRLLMQGQG